MKVFNIIKKNFIKVFTVCFLVVVTLIPILTSAQSGSQNNAQKEDQENLMFFLATQYKADAVSTDNYEGRVIVNVVKTLFSVLGIIFLVVILYGGFRWTTAGGNQEQVDNAKKLITNSVLGLLVVFLAYIITVGLLVWLAGDTFKIDFNEFVSGIQ